MASGPDLTVGDPGVPEVNAEQLHEDQVLDDEPGGVPFATDTIVRGVLMALGTGANQLGRDEALPNVWKFDDDELDLLVPALTRVINKPGRERLRAAVLRGDELTVGIAMAGYLGRNVSDLNAARKARADGLDRETTGAPYGGGPAGPGRPGWPVGDDGHGGGLHPAAGGGVA